MAQYMFGSGNLTLIPPVGASDVTPVQIAILRDVSLDVTMTTKELRGAYTFPVDIARAGAKVSGKAKYATVNGGIIASIFDVASTSGEVVESEENSPSGTSLTVSHSANFVADHGVINASTGVPLAKVTSGATGQQYSVSAGAYTFGTTGSYNVRYSWTNAGVGKTTKLVNTLMGSSTVYQVRLFNTFRSKHFGVKLYAATVPKIAFSFKNEDYTESDVDFECFADASGNVIEFYTEE